MTPGLDRAQSPSPTKGDALPVPGNSFCTDEHPGARVPRERRQGPHRRNADPLGQVDCLPVAETPTCALHGSGMRFQRSRSRGRGRRPAGYGVRPPRGRSSAAVARRGQSVRAAHRRKVDSSRPPLDRRCPQCPQLWGSASVVPNGTSSTGPQPTTPERAAPSSALRGDYPVKSGVYDPIRPEGNPMSKMTLCL